MLHGFCLRLRVLVLQPLGARNTETTNSPVPLTLATQLLRKEQILDSRDMRLTGFRPRSNAGSCMHETTQHQVVAPAAETQAGQTLQEGLLERRFTKGSCGSWRGPVWGALRIYLSCMLPSCSPAMGRPEQPFHVNSDRAAQFLLHASLN